MRIKCISEDGNSFISKGKEYEVINKPPRDGYKIVNDLGRTYWYKANLFEILPEGRVHHDLIIQWAKGAEIEYFHKYNHKWVDCKNPNFYEDYEYRVKPTEHKITIDGKDIMLSEESFEALREQLL